MKKQICLTLSFFAGYAIGHWANLTMDAYAEHLVIRNASNLTVGVLPNARLDPSSVTLSGNDLLRNSMLDPSSATLQGNALIISTVASGLQNLTNRVDALPPSTESTFTITLGGYGVFPSTYLPVEGATFRVSKATLVICGMDAWINKPSSVVANSTVFLMFHSSGGGYGINWSSMSPPVAVQPDLSGSSDQARHSIYISTRMEIYDGNFIGIGITTVPISGVTPVDWGVNLHCLIRRAGVAW